MSKKRFWRPLLLYILAFLVLWNVILPLSFRKKLREAFLTVQVPLWELSAGLGAAQKRLALQTFSKSELLHYVRELTRENEALRRKLAENADKVDLAERILQLNAMDVGEQFQCLPARVLYRSTEAWAQRLLINRGSNDGVREGQGVVCTKGVVGRIGKVTPKTAFVELVTSVNFRLLVRLEGEAEPCLLQSKALKNGKCSSGKATLLLAPDTDEKNFPRTVETVAVGHQFPEHFYVGQCVKIKQKDNQSFGVVRFGHYLDLLDEVGVLIPSLNL